jgi:hypothetical protein
VSDFKTLPLSTDDLIKLFENPNEVLRIDYQNSTIKGQALLTYLANVKINCSLENIQELSFEEKEELLNLFINSRYFMEVSTFKDALVKCFLGYGASAYFLDEEFSFYKEKNEERLTEIEKFYHSMLVAIPSISNEFRAHILDPEIKEGKIEEIKGTDIITPNIYSLVFYPNFIDMFLGHIKKEYPLAFYGEVLETYQYKNKSFYALLLETETSPAFMALFNYFFTEKDESLKLA